MKKNLTKQTLLIYWQHAKRYKGAVFVLIVSLILARGIGIYIPVLYKDFFDTLVQMEPGQASGLLKIIILVLVFNIIANVFWRITGYLNNFFQPRVSSDLLVSSFERLHHHSYRFFNNNFVGSLVRRVNRFENSFETIADQLYWHIGSTVLAVVFILIVLFARHWGLGLIVLIWSVIYSASNIWYSSYIFKYNIDYAATDSKASGYLADTVTNSSNLKVFASIKRELGKYKQLTDDLFRIRKFTWDLREHANLVQAIMMFLLEFIAFYFAIRFWQQGLITVGDFALLQVYLFSVFYFLWDIGRYVQRFYEGLAEAEEMTAIYLTEPEIIDKPGAKGLRVEKGRIEFKDVSFGYQGGPGIFRRFNMSVRSGEKLALVGPSGGGKSTIVKLLLRYFDVQKGEILIDGQNIADVTQDGLRANIALVPQESILFHRPLLENIRYARPSASKAEVIRAAKLAHAHEFISKFSDGYDTFVGERGIKLSGGERQRVAIARAILKDAPILVLDEATSSLDSESEMYIKDALKVLMKGRTTIVIAHRLSTIMQMDRIVVLDHGKITEEGGHEDLLKVKEGTYQRLWDIQAGGFAAR